MTQDELKALIERDEHDIVDVLTTSVKNVPNEDAMLFAVLQMQMLARIVYWTSDVLAAGIGEWDSEASALALSKEHYDA